jgi:hypothetical protein
VRVSSARGTPNVKTPCVTSKRSAVLVCMSL